jgi:peptidoglycan glycosyltransferase
VVLYKAAPKKWLDVSSPERTRLIHNWMKDVVNEGTGTAAAINGISVAGKTGTAENSEGEDHAWFRGSAEVEGRRVAFAVLVENGGAGGRVAAPIARSIVQSLMR